MSSEHDEQEALLEEIRDVGYCAPEGDDVRCADGDRAMDGEVPHDGLCDTCWRERQRWRGRPDCKRLSRVVAPGHWYEA